MGMGTEFGLEDLGVIAVFIVAVLFGVPLLMMLAHHGPGLMRAFNERFLVSGVSLDDDPDYVTPPYQRSAYRDAHSIGGNAEGEKRAEVEARTEAPRVPSSADINTLLSDTRDEATARALGVLLGSGLIVPEGRTRAMVALFGPAGRKHTRVRPLVDTAEASANAARAADAPPEDIRLVTLDAGGPNERKMVL